jgi:hypothetical protein
MDKQHSQNRNTGRDSDPKGDKDGWVDDEWYSNPIDMEVQVSGEGLESEHFEEYIGP